MLKSSDKIVGVGEGRHASDRAISEIPLATSMLSQTMAPRLFLEVMASLFENTPPDSVTLRDALNALLAERVLHERDCLPDASDAPNLVFLLSGVVARFMHRVVEDTGPSTNAPFQDQALADLRAQVERANDSVSRFFAGLNLGDRGLHVASGWVGQRDFVRRTTASTRSHYATAMAALGYGTAFAALNHSASTSMAAGGGPLAFVFKGAFPPPQQLHRAVRALSALRSEKDRIKGLLLGEGPSTFTYES